LHEWTRMSRKRLLKATTNRSAFLWCRSALARDKAFRPTGVKGF
jgi:hypothetical protein